MLVGILGYESRTDSTANKTGQNVGKGQLSRAE
jgi:hypothetical protein